MSVVFQSHQVPRIAVHGAPAAKAGVMAGLGKAVLFAVPTVLIAAAMGYGLKRAFDVRWDEFSRRVADGESTLG